MTSLNNSPNTAPPTSSPPLPPSPMVSTKKRVTRTYGSKRVEAPPSDEPLDADRSFATLVEDDVSISLSPAARLRGIDDNAVSSQDTKVDDNDDDDDDDGDEGKGDPARRPKHQWSWMAALDKLNEPDDETESTPALSIPQRSTGADASPSPPVSPGRGIKSKEEHTPPSPKRTRRLPLTTVRSDPRFSARASAEPEASGSDGDHSPSPFPPKQKRRTSGRIADQSVVEDSESDAPRASSSKSRGGRSNLEDVEIHDRTSPGPAKRKRRSTTGRKPTVKVKYHVTHSVGSCSRPNEGKAARGRRD